MTKRPRWKEQFKRERSELWLSMANGYMTATGLLALSSADWVVQALGAAAVAASIVFQRGVFVRHKRAEIAAMKFLDKEGGADNE